MSNMSHGICSRRPFKTLLVFLFLVLVVMILENGGLEKKTTIDDDDDMQDVGRLEHTTEAKDTLWHQRFDLHLVSKRRVPRGPDPIHNRRTGNSHQPPGRA
ncbi:hypothetical protein Leryth_022680 [Lithospermum erythrorhizon]|uniref:Uncharacterized protein n=1 Tax=Lithospermum erythrorhizon TaxID=34254 RepID=A0AAV3NLX8_LITER|nr:hypothetical protein Leryth_022680 [Lithospermum erythrorhizon]